MGHTTHGLVLVERESETEDEKGKMRDVIGLGPDAGQR